MPKIKMLSLFAIYIIIALIIEVIAYSILVAFSATITNNYYGQISSISAAIALSPGLKSYFISIIYIFSLGRNGYEFFIDPYDRIHAWNTNKGLYAAIWLKIIFLNLFLLFLLLIGSINIFQDSYLHNIYAIISVVCYIIHEFICIGTRSYYAFIGYFNIIKSFPLYVFLLCLEGIFVIITIIYALCFINIFDSCPSNSNIAYISEYLMFATIITTPFFRFLD